MLFVISIVGFTWSHFAIKECTKHDYLRHHLKAWKFLHMAHFVCFEVLGLNLIFKIF